MTTNSPNPFVGDVQAHQMPILTDGERDKAIRDFTVRAVNTDCDVSLLAYQIALAALTAERCGSLIQAVNPKTGSVNIFYRSRGIESIDPEEIAEWEMQEVEHLYTTPPAQLLRPVELPTAYDIVERGPAYHTFRDLELDEDGAWLRKDEVIEALRQQGYEVKS
ncbi:hypothetical protein [Pantoea ananatis]|uniref:hypothetical protein n=1 Tax=Pantoea ananas TaxID=553 RepID=UPI001B30C771|nr:hypothetical protein [Pantoea ananatis]